MSFCFFCFSGSWPRRWLSFLASSGRWRGGLPMSRGALDRLAGPMLVFLGVSTIVSSALLVPVVSSRRAGEGVKKTQSPADAEDGRETMVRWWSYSLRVHYSPP